MSKKFLAMILAGLVSVSAMAFSAMAVEEAEEAAAENEVTEVSEETEIEQVTDPVAKVGDTEYATIDEAIAAWTNGKTLTLLSDVELTDVITLKSTEKHVLDLGTYTMTAASKKDAITFSVDGTGQKANVALEIYADATNPGGINAPGKSCIVTNRTNAQGQDRPLTRIYGGVFSGSYAVKHSSSNGTNAPVFEIYGGIFDGMISANRATVIITGGTFNKSISLSVDSSSYCRIQGGKFKTAPSSYSELNSSKWTYGTAKGNLNADIYIDADGYYVVDCTEVSEKPGAYQASANSAFNSTFAYSAIKDDGAVYVADAEYALNNFKDVKLYVDCEMDKTVNSGSTFTIDATEKSFTGDVTLTKTGTFVIKYPEASPYMGTVTNDTDHYGIKISEVVEDGIVTKTYAGYEIIDETNGVLMIADGDNVEYFKSFDLAAESLYGTTGKTITLIKDLTSIFINSNSYKDVPTKFTLDLNGHSITATNINGNTFKGTASITFVDSSADKAGTVTKDILAKIAKYGYTPIVKSGTWYADPTSYLAYGYEAVETDNGYYFVQLRDETTTEVIPDTSSENIKIETDVYCEDENGNITGGEIIITLPSDAFEGTSASTIYLNVIATEPHEAAAEFVGETATVYEIEFVDENDDEVEFVGTAIVEIPYSGKNPELHRVYFIREDGTYEDMNAVYDAEKKAFVFETTHLSQYAVVNSELLQSGIATNVKIQYKATSDPNVYEIYAVAEDGKQINRFSSTQLKFELINDTTDRTDVAYTLAPANNIKMSDPDADGYVLFNFDGVNAEDSDVASEVLFATVTFEGYGKFAFKTIDDTDKAMLHTATILDNIVVDYTCAAANGYDLILTEAGNEDNAFGVDTFGGIIDGQFYVPTKNLTVKIDFPNAIENSKAAEYQQMKLTVSGGDLEQALIVDLGNEFAVSDLAVYDGRQAPAVAPAFANGAYTVEITGLLTQNTAYVVTVEGAGYRTARYTVNTQEVDKVLNFWNNVKDNAVNVEEGKDSSAKNVTFLAGDIVKDNNINIYDLSAVVSYFGEIDLDEDNKPEYAKYDLNRDGKIDSKDVAYVLVSWGN